LHADEICTAADNRWNINRSKNRTRKVHSRYSGGLTSTTCYDISK